MVTYAALALGLCNGEDESRSFLWGYMRQKRDVGWARRAFLYEMMLLSRIMVPSY